MSGSTTGMSGWKRRWPILVVGAVLVAFAWPLCRRSIVLADEGYLLLQSLDLLNGKVPYRDMDTFITPGMWFLLAGTFKLLGPSVIASRVPVLLALLTLYGVSYRITTRLADWRYGLLTLALLMICTVWAFPGWTFAFYSPFAVTFALLALERLLAWREASRARDLVLCGVWVGLAIVFKQNYGVFALVGVTVGLVAIRIEQRRAVGDALRAAFGDALRMATGVALAGLPAVVWLGVQGALPAAWQSLAVHPFEFGDRHDIPYLPLAAIFKPGLMDGGAEMLTYAAQPIYRVPPATGWLREIGFVERLHVPFYWTPPVVLALGVALAYRPDAGRQTNDERPLDAGLLSVVAVAGLIFLGVFPRADFNHLTNVYQPIVVAGVVVGHHLMSRRRRPTRLWARVAMGAVFLTAAVYALVAGYWYWGLLEYVSTPVPVERAGVLAREEQAQRIHYQVGLIQEETAPGEAVLTLPDLSMLNFLADRPMPSAYYNLYEHHIAHDGGAAVVAGAERHGVTLAVTRFNDFFSDRVGLRDYAPALTHYLATHYDMEYTVGREDFILFRRRSEPRPLPETVSLLEHCDISAGYQRIKEHLLFPALYHDPGTGRDMTLAALETPCKVQVPEAGAVLSVRIGYRAPALVLQDTTLTAEIVALGDRENELLLRQTFRVRGQGPNVFRKAPYREFRIDLARWAGRELKLVLRTIRRGVVLIRPLEQRGFGTVWEDPKLIVGARE